MYSLLIVLLWCVCSIYFFLLAASSLLLLLICALSVCAFQHGCLYFTPHVMPFYFMCLQFLALPITLVSGAARAKLIDIVQKADIVQGDVGRKGLAQGRVGHMA